MTFRYVIHVVSSVVWKRRRDLRLLHTRLNVGIRILPHIEKRRRGTRGREIKSRANVTSWKLGRSPLTPENLTSYYSRPICILLLGKFLSRPVGRHKSAWVPWSRKGARSLNKASLWCHPRVNYEICLCLRVDDYQNQDIVPARRCGWRIKDVPPLRAGYWKEGPNKKLVFQHRDLNTYGIIHCWK